MREICKSGSMRGMWKRGYGWLLRHRQTKGTATAMQNLLLPRHIPTLPRVKVPATAKQTFPRLIPKDIQGTHKHNWRLSRRNFVKRQGAGKVRLERRLDIPREYATVVDTITALTTELFKVVNGKEVNVRCVVPLVR